MLLGLHHLSSFKQTKICERQYIWDRNPAITKLPSVTRDSEYMVAEQYTSFYPNLRPFEQLTAAFQLCVCLQHLWSLIIHLGQYSYRKAYRAWHIQVKLRCNSVLSRSAFTLLDQEWVSANAKAGWGWGAGDRSIAYKQLVAAPYIYWLTFHCSSDFGLFSFCWEALILECSQQPFSVQQAENPETTAVPSACSKISTWLKLNYNVL